MYMCMYVCIYIYIYINSTTSLTAGGPGLPPFAGGGNPKPRQVGPGLRDMSKTVTYLYIPLSLYLSLSLISFYI